MRNMNIISLLIFGLLFSASAQQKMNMADTAKHRMAMHHIARPKKSKKNVKYKHHRSAKKMKMGNAASHRKKMNMPVKHSQSSSMAGMRMGNAGEDKKMDRSTKDMRQGSMNMN